MQPLNRQQDIPHFSNRNNKEWQMSCFRLFVNLGFPRNKILANPWNSYVPDFMPSGDTNKATFAIEQRKYNQV